MYTTPEQLSTANKANVETLLTIANTAFASAERLAALNPTPPACCLRMPSATPRP